VEAIHDQLLSSLWPGSEAVGRGGLRDRGLLESALHRPFQSAFGKDIYPRIEEKAAALFHSLIANHPFVDGNKRTAVTAVSLFLLANNVFWSVGNDVMYKLATETASYRERGLSHDVSYLVILLTLRIGITPIEKVSEEIRESARTEPKKTLDLVWDFIQMRKALRRSRYFRNLD